MALVVGILLAIFVVDGPWQYVLVVAGAAIEAGQAVFWWRWSHRRRPAVGVEALVGATAVVVEPCDPEGRVRAAGELWSARCDDHAEPGDEVRIVGIDGLLLHVEPA